MNIEIDRPELEALIQQRMASGRFQSVEDVLIAALKSSPDLGEEPESRQAGGKPEARVPGRKSLAELFAESPFRGLGMEFPRAKDPLRPIDL